MRTELDLFVLGREPMEVGVFDDVIQRQEPTDIEGRIGEAPVADVGNLQRPVDALVGDPADSRAVLETDDGNGLFHGKSPGDEALNEARRAEGVRVEISGVLSAGEHAAVEADHRDPLGVFLDSIRTVQGLFPGHANEQSWSLDGSVSAWQNRRLAAVPFQPPICVTEDMD